MFIRLIPTPPQTAVIFTVSYPDIDNNPNIPLPPSWDEQIRILKHDDLELPTTIHALDRAAGLVGIILEITFDVPALTISCRMVDGTVEEWPLMEKRCLSALESVVSDVNESALVEREIELENEKRRFESPNFISGKITRHKKQRSLLMTFVAYVPFFPLIFSPANTLFTSSIIPSISLSSSRLPSPPLQATPRNSSSSTCSTLSTYELSHKSYYHRARATLIDTCRRYVLCELSHRVPPGGYYAWILQSLLRRTMESINLVLENGVPHHHHRYQIEAGFDSEQGEDDAESPTRANCGHSSIYDPVSEGPDSEFFSITATSLPPSPDSSDDEGDETETSTETEETETDGSSVHTPTSSSTNCPVSVSTPTSTSSNNDSDIDPARQSHDADADVNIASSPVYIPPQKRQHAHVSSRPSRPQTPTPTSPQTPTPSLTPTPTHPQTPTQPHTITLTQSDHALYTSLLEIHLHLQNLHDLESTRQRIIASEEQRQLAVLEVRGRRRAWLNGQLCEGWSRSEGGACIVDIKGSGRGFGPSRVRAAEALALAMPFRSSPLASCEPWSAAEWEYVGPVSMSVGGCGRRRAGSFGEVYEGDEAFEEEHEDQDKLGAGCDAAREYGEFDRLHQTRTLGIGMSPRGRAHQRSSRLFPVSESEEDLDLADHPHSQHHRHHHLVGADFQNLDVEMGMGIGVDFGIDLESGCGPGLGLGYEDVYGDGFDGYEQHRIWEGMHVTFEEVESLRLRPRPIARRVRTSSMYNVHHPVELQLGPPALVPAPVYLCPHRH
jgi:hypothetical protein